MTTNFEEMDAKFDKLKDIRVMVGTPMIDGKCTGRYKNALLDLVYLLAKWGTGFCVHDVYGESVISKARNKLADEFMKSALKNPDDRLLLIDSDITFNAEDIVHMLLLDKDVVAAPCTLKKINWERVRQASLLGFPAYKLPNLTGDIVADFITEGGAVDEPVEVSSSGCGVMMIKRSVFEKMKVELPEIRYALSKKEMGKSNQAFAYAYFQNTIDPDPPHRYLDEDWFFCKNWRRLGGKVHTCLWIKTQHIGNYEYQMDIPAIVEFSQKLEESKKAILDEAKNEKSPVHA